MVTLQFNISINAPREKVWKALWDESNYQQWTAVFGEGSSAKSDWQEGSTIQFLGANGDGMYGRIDKMVPNTQMTFKHLGEIRNGEQKESEWAGALESYFLTGNGAATELFVEMDTAESHQQYFKDTFPKALQIVKQLAEQ